MPAMPAMPAVVESGMEAPRVVETPGMEAPRVEAVRAEERARDDERLAPPIVCVVKRVGVVEVLETLAGLVRDVAVFYVMDGGIVFIIRNQLNVSILAVFF